MKYLLTGEDTERLNFRLLQLTDYADWLPLFVDTDAARFLGMTHLASSEEQCDFWFERSMGRYDNGTGGMNVLVDKQTGKMIGQCGLLVQELEGESILEVGYSMLPQYWGKGYATEAARKCRDYAFTHGYAKELYSIIHIENYGSVKVAENNGMSFCKTLPDYKGMPVNIYRITREEWQQQTA
ncbi:MAG: acetyltransferase, family [Flavipsychrobacter sp.]|nr:acetyltransferase, family [Flavipsychrobacter sp.]